MPSPSATPTPLTPPRVPLIDQRTGLIDRAWYQFFLSLYRASEVVTNDSVTGTDVDSLLASYDAALRGAAQYTETLPPTQDCCAEVAEIRQALGVLADTGNLSALAELAKQVDALAQAPVYTPNLRSRAYGSFYDTTTQTAAAINTAYGMKFNTTDIANAIYVGSPTSRIYVDKSGVFDIQFGAQLDNTSGGNHLAFMWLRKNGTDVAQSAIQVRLKGTDGELFSTINYLQQLNAGDYIEVMWSVSDTAVQITAQAAAAPVPAIPSVVLTITDNINAMQD